MLASIDFSVTAGLHFSSRGTLHFEVIRYVNSSNSNFKNFNQLELVSVVGEWSPRLLKSAKFCNIYPLNHWASMMSRDLVGGIRHTFIIPIDRLNNFTE